MNTILAVVLVLVMAGALLLVPLGLPGVWLMLLVLLGVAVAGEVAWTTWAILAVLTALAEAVEFAVLARIGRRYGGSPRAFWGAVVGGFVGAIVGAPLPVVGALLGGVAGTFLGAAAVTLRERRSLEEASRVGWGMTLARALAVAIKTAVGIAVLVVGGTALFVG